MSSSYETDAISISDASYNFRSKSFHKRAITN